MSESFIDTSKIAENIDSNRIRIYDIDSKLSNIISHIENAEKLYLQFIGYNGSLVYPDIPPEKYYWKTAGYNNLSANLKNMEKILKNIFKDIKEIEQFVYSLENSNDDIKSSIAEIETILSETEIRQFKNSNNNIKLDFTEQNALNAIQSNIDENKKLSNSFSKVLYQDINEELADILKGTGE